MAHRAYTLLLLSIVLSVSLVAGVSGQTQQGVLEPDRIVGRWITADGKAHIQISRCGETYCGTIVWLKEPEKHGRPVMDDKNPDEKLRERPILGMQLLYGFMYDGDNVWNSGRVYDPESGDEYRGKLKLVDGDTMELRGYVMIPLFGRTETWKRVSTEPPGLSQ
jgi:uncharacterized protein (DUF2147 family)